MSYFVNLKNANAETARLAGELSAAHAERDTFKAALAERDAAAESVRATFDATLSDLTAKLSEANKEINDLKASAQTASQQAAEVIAAQGIDPARIPAASAAPSLAAAELGNLIRAESDPKKRAALFSQLQTVWKSNN